MIYKCENYSILKMLAIDNSNIRFQCYHIPENFCIVKFILQHADID